MTHRIEVKRHFRLTWARTARRSTKTGAEESPAARKRIDRRPSFGQATTPRLFSVTAVESL